MLWETIRREASQNGAKILIHTRKAKGQTKSCDGKAQPPGLVSNSTTLTQLCVFLQGLAVGFVLLRVESLVEEGKI